MKDKILDELNYDTVSFRDGDGGWFVGIDKADFNDLADRLVKLFSIPVVSNPLSCDGCKYHNTIDDEPCVTCGDTYKNKAT